MLERVDGGVVSAADGDEDQSLEGLAESVGVEVCVVQGERLRPTRSASSVTVRRANDPR